MIIILCLEDINKILEYYIRIDFKITPHSHTINKQSKLQIILHISNYQ